MPALISLNRHSPQARGLQAWAPFGGGLTQRPYWGADYAGTASDGTALSAAEGNFEVASPRARE